MKCVIDELIQMEIKGVEVLKIYYAEDIEEGSESWSVDVMQDELNNLCDMGWTWTVTHKNEFIDNFNDCNELTYICSDWEIIVDKPFSEEVVCKAINIWLDSNDINIKVEMIDIKDAEGSGYIKTLQERLAKNEDLFDSSTAE